MAEYIDREALLALVQPDDPHDGKAAITIAAAKKLIRSLAHRVPAADVAPVRHWWWIPRGEHNDIFECALCSEEVWDEKTPYCPYCGAKMDWEAES